MKIFLTIGFWGSSKAEVIRIVTLYIHVSVCFIDKSKLFKSLNVKTLAIFVIIHLIKSKIIANLNLPISEEKLLKPAITVAQGGIQLIFQFVIFLASGDSLASIDIHKSVSIILKEL